MKYEKIKYPDGQISAKVELEYYNDEGLHINERINSYEDLFYIKSIVEAARNVMPNCNILLTIPCMFGQRSDRRFENMQSFDLKIITDFINECNFKNVCVFDPHSDTTLALLNRSYKVLPIQFIRNIVGELRGKDPNNELVLVSPDAGAYKKVFEFGKELNMPVVAGVKHRDRVGNIDLTFMGDVKGKQCLIVDDLCDGGYTFLQLGKKLKEQGAEKVYLYVSHGYFSKGFEELNQVLDGIYCTNSVKDIGDFEPDSAGKLHKTNLKQFKII